MGKPPGRCGSSRRVIVDELETNEPPSISEPGREPIAETDEEHSLTKPTRVRVGCSVAVVVATLLLLLAWWDFWPAIRLGLHRQEIAEALEPGKDWKSAEVKVRELGIPITVTKHAMIVGQPNPPRSCMFVQRILIRLDEKWMQAAGKFVPTGVVYVYVNSSGVINNRSSVGPFHSMDPPYGPMTLPRQ